MRVLQGFLASALSFNLALDPLLIAFERALDFCGKRIVHAYAENLAFALSRLSHLKLVFPIYMHAECLAGFGLSSKSAH